MRYTDNTIKIIPFGGLDGIGCNLTVFEYNDDILIVDAGLMFSDEDTPGVDYLIPDLSYISRNRRRVKGIVITHGHEDHIGAISYLLKECTAPVYASKFTHGLIQTKLDERPVGNKPDLIEVSPRDVVHIGAFRVEFIKVNHSIADPVALAINTDIGTIIHTGDFKIDLAPLDGNVIDLARFSEYGDKGVLLLMSDSTNALKEGHSKSETSLTESIMDVFANAKGRIIIASFASNIHRIQQALDAAHRYNKKVALSGATVQKNFDIASKLGYLSVKKDLMIDQKKTANYTDKKVVVVCTGSQGETMSSLSRMAAGTHQHIVIGEKDTVIISASVIPGREKMVNRVVNALLKLGANVYYDEDIHASGHAAAEELKLIISLTKPKFFMPIHGEYRHLKAHADLAHSLNIKESNTMIAGNGDILEVNSKDFIKTDEIKLGRIFVDGRIIGDAQSDMIKERLTIANNGIVVISAVISGSELRDVKVAVRGMVTHKSDATELLRLFAREEIQKLLIEGKVFDEIISTLKKKAKKYIINLTGKSPLIDVQILKS